ncbi:MAG: L,D-transpeptidase, partial [Eubacteriales bacterium]|nr:L,D-transpeptidase [Eubacteriales bacterium]
VVVQNLTTGKSQILEKNTQVAAAAKSGSSITAWLKNGDKIKISSANLKYQKGTYRRYADEQATRVLKETYNKVYIDSKSDYTTAAKEEYINSLSLTSPTKYLVWISQYRARVNIFQKKSGKWRLIRSFPCMIGRSGSQKGIYSIRYKFNTGDHGGPSLQWTGSKPWEGNMFHPNFRGDLNGYKDISKNGVAHSGGCIRCTQTQLNWMKKNLGIGTTVYSY